MADKTVHTLGVNNTGRTGMDFLVKKIRKVPRELQAYQLPFYQNIIQGHTTKIRFVLVYIPSML